jgi:uncharacterized protein (DUF433 family)
MYGAVRSRVVARLAGVSLHQLQYWHETELIQAHVVPGARGYPRLYSWADYLRVRAAKKLLDHGLTTERMRTAIEYLDEHVPDWYRRPLAVHAGRALIEIDDRLVTADPARQETLPALRDVLLEIEQEGPLGELRQFSEYIDMNPEVVAGNPVLKGTRIETGFISALRARGMDEAEIAASYRLTPEQVHAALEFDRAAA